MNRQSESPITCFDLLPPLYHTLIRDPKKVVIVLRLLNFILEGIIQSQTVFFQNKQYSLFNPHAKKSCCQISAVNILLQETHSVKSSLEFNYLIDYLRSRKIYVKNKIQYFEKQNTFYSPLTLIQFLEKNELVFVINLIDKYIFVTYFLTMCKEKKFRCAHQIMFDYYKIMVATLSHEVIKSIAVDINQQKKSEESLQIAKKQAIAANRAKTEFLENMRHDIRTPLTGIIGFARLIQQEAKSPHVKEYTDNLVLATTALLDFQNEILDAIKKSSNSEPMVQETFHLKNLVEKILNLLRPKAIVKKLALSFLIGNDLPHYVRGDAKRLFRILLELITNALKFTAQGSISIHLSISKINNDQFMLHCKISDTGIGIPDDKKDDVFTRFHRLSPSSDGVYEGSGLGLTIVKKYVGDLNGKITVESMLGHGTTFVFSIPLWFANEPVAKITKIQNMTEKITFTHKKILLVEDHPMTATVTELMLLELGCVVDIARDAKTALEKVGIIGENAKDQPRKFYDLILMDLGLPDCDGFELAKKIRAEDNRVQIVVLTAHCEDENASRCQSSGINAIFQKPLLKSTAIDLLNTYKNAN